MTKPRLAVWLGGVFFIDEYSLKLLYFRCPIGRPHVQEAPPWGISIIRGIIG